MSSLPDQNAEHDLRRFCATVLDLLSAEPTEGTLETQVFESLARSIRDGSREAVARLEQEMPAWEEASHALRGLIRSSLFQFGDEAAMLLAKLEDSRTRVARL